MLVEHTRTADEWTTVYHRAAQAGAPKSVLEDLAARVAKATLAEYEASRADDDDDDDDEPCACCGQPMGDDDTPSGWCVECHESHHHECPECGDEYDRADEPMTCGVCSCCEYAHGERMADEARDAVEQLIDAGKADAVLAALKAAGLI